MYFLKIEKRMFYQKIRKNRLTISVEADIIAPVLYGQNASRQADIAGLCKGSTTDSDSVCEGSNPSPAAKSDLRKQVAFLVFSGIV